MRKNNRAFLLIALLLLVIVLGLCAWLLFGDGLGGVRETESTPAPIMTPAPPRDTPPGTQPVQETAAPDAAPAATQTPEPTEQPVIETRAPLETEEPTSAPADSVDVSGSFTSDTGTWLNLLVRWSAKGSGDKVQLTVELCSQSYSLYSVAAYGNLELTVNGVTYRGDTPAINCEGKDLTVTPLDSFTVEVPQGMTEITAVWHFKGSYSGKELDTITASANAFIG